MQLTPADVFKRAKEERAKYGGPTAEAYAAAQAWILEQILVVVGVPSRAEEIVRRALAEYRVIIRYTVTPGRPKGGIIHLMGADAVELVEAYARTIALAQMVYDRREELVAEEDLPKIQDAPEIIAMLRAHEKINREQLTDHIQIATTVSTAEEFEGECLRAIGFVLGNPNRENATNLFSVLYESLSVAMSPDEDPASMN